MITYCRLLLEPGEVARLDAGRRLHLLCEGGTLWVTAGDEGMDHGLACGDTVDCGPGRILVEGPGSLLVQAGASRWRRRPALLDFRLISAPQLGACHGGESGA